MRTSIIALLCLLIASCATEIPESTQFPQNGEPTPSPYGWVEFCEREPEQC